MTADLEVADMQGLLVSSYAHLPCATYLLLRIVESADARDWLRRLSAEITTAERKQERASRNVAFTMSGVKNIGLSVDALETFPAAFKEGMASARRAKVLGDVGRNASTEWQWGGAATAVDVVLLIYASNEQELQGQIETWTPSHERGLTVIERLDAQRPIDAREHFGFLDGVGQPAFQGSGRAAGQKRRTGHVTELPPGEFVLGYENAYGTIAPGPTVSASDACSKLLPPARDDENHRRDLGRNGSYLVFRQMQQDVAAFWRYVAKAAECLWPGDLNAAERLAAKFVGRWPSGAPLVRYPRRDPFDGAPQSNPDNTFAYAASDEHGYGCPLGAHIRRANPRDTLGPDPVTARMAANRHRLLRRGRSYGRRIAQDRLTVDDGVERGLHFIGLNADLERQFEFVQQTWVNSPVFAGLFDETDPLVGDQSSCGQTFTVQDTPVRRRAQNLEPFVTVRGGAYFFLPGIRALRYFARDGGTQH